ncbi:MAG TPA: sulfite exporter TauE/SafE family protein [Candidatus Limnocylindrales bacterium]|nr:sulfite exporter TauE/SafE family protein [Candidatus Limnocylindrales bacterium]
MDWGLIAAGFGVGTIVGLTGMGGGALMTPILVLFFGVPPLTAVSSDLVASAVMKPVGSAVHIRRGGVDWRLVGWLCLGSVPAAFCGVLVSKALGNGARVQDVVQIALGVALLLAVLGLVLRGYVRLREQSRRLRDGGSGDGTEGPVVVRPLATVVLGALGGLVVGMTSVGSGSLIIVALLALYPMLRPNKLVGTDLVQAVPLVTAAALGHILFGDFRFELTTALLIGSIPGAFLGAQLSSRAPGGLIRRALALVLLASALKLLHVSNEMVGVAVVAAFAAGTLGWMVLRRANGLPALGRLGLQQG